MIQMIPWWPLWSKKHYVGDVRSYWNGWWDLGCMGDVFIKNVTDDYMSIKMELYYTDTTTTTLHIFYVDWNHHPPLQ